MLNSIPFDKRTLTAEERERLTKPVRGLINSVKNKNSQEQVVSQPKQQTNSLDATAQTIAKSVNNALASVLGDGDNAKITVNVTEDTVNSGPIIPITFTKSINEDGSVVGEENVLNTPVNVDVSNPYIAMMPTQVPPQSFDANITTIYPQLKQHEELIKSLGLDCYISRNSYGLIEVAIIKNNAIDVRTSYTVDMDGVILGPEPKWLNTYMPEMPYEDYCCIPLDRTDLLEKYLKNSADIEELASATIYSSKYLNVNKVVDLRTIPANVDAKIKERVIGRLNKAIDNKVFDDGLNLPGKYVFKNFIDVTSFELIKGNILVTFSKDQANVTISQ